MEGRSSCSSCRQSGPTANIFHCRTRHPWPLPPQPCGSSAVAIGVSYCCGPVIRRLGSVVMRTGVEDGGISVQICGVLTHCCDARSFRPNSRFARATTFHTFSEMSSLGSSSETRTPPIYATLVVERLRNSLF